MKTDRQNRIILVAPLLVCSLLGRGLLVSAPDSPIDVPCPTASLAAPSPKPATVPLYKPLQVDYVAHPPTCGTGYVASGGGGARLWLRAGDGQPDVRYTVQFHQFGGRTHVRGVLSPPQAERIVVDLLRLERSLSEDYPYGASPIEVRLLTATLHESRRGAGLREVKTPQLDALLHRCWVDSRSRLPRKWPVDFFD